MKSSPPPFPVVGVVTPMVVGAGLWVFLGSPFAVVGAVIGPAMVVAHYGDSLRRFRRDSRRRSREEAADHAMREASARATHVAACRAQNTLYPSIRQIRDSPNWTPPFDQRNQVRVGTESRDGVDGFPWRVSIARGVSVVGDGPVAESVWRSLVVHSLAAHGPTNLDSDRVAWASGAWIHRGAHVDAEISIRCSASAIETVTVRGCLPEAGEWCPDDSDGWESIIPRVNGSRADAVHWVDRERCATGVGLVDGQPFAIDVTSESPHVLVCGRTGTGKSEFLAALLCDWAERFTPTRLSWVGFDFKGGATLAPLSELPHCSGVVTDLDDDDTVTRALFGMAAELRDRERHLRDEGVARIDESKALGRLVVVIDEFPELLRVHPESLDVLADVARRGRSLGVHIVLATQNVSAIHRDGLAANIAVRVCFPLASEHDVVNVLGVRPRVQPVVGNPVVVCGDGVQSRVIVRSGATVRSTRFQGGESQARPWLSRLEPPIAAGEGFGRIDDVVTRSQEPARWTGGDVVVVGQRGSGRTTALHSIADKEPATTARTIDDIAHATGLVIIDDLDRIHDELPDSRKHELSAVLAARRRECNPPTFLMSVTAWVPRLHGLVPNVLVLGLPTRDSHVATGEPPETFDPSAKPGVGSWRGRRVIVYASTDSIDTESMP